MNVSLNWFIVAAYICGVIFVMFVVPSTRLEGDKNLTWGVVIPLREVYVPFVTPLRADLQKCVV